jgi:16S rRNA (guanine527-N7)-methyltransferase
MESFIAATLVEDEPIEWLDVGSGGGSPAIPLKVVRNQLYLTMVEARARKAAFLREATRNLNLPNVEVLAERVEMLSEPMAGAVDLITIRAVRLDDELLRVFKKLLDVDGHLMIFGSDQTPDGFQVVQRAALPGGDSFVTTYGLPDPLLRADPDRPS